MPVRVCGCAGGIFHAKKLAIAVAGIGMTATVVAAILIGYVIWQIDWGHGRQWKVGLVCFFFFPFAIFFAGMWLSDAFATAIDPSRPPLFDSKQAE